MTLKKWSETSDWDNAANESSVRHPHGHVTLDTITDGFSDGDYTANPSWTHNGVGTASVSSVTQPDGSTGNVLDIDADSVSTWATVELDISANNPVADFTWIGAFKRPSSDNHADGGIAFRVQDSNNYYFIRDGSGGSDYSFGYVSSGTVNDSVLNGTLSRSTANQWSVWKVVVSGNTIELYSKAPGGSFTRDFSTTDSTITSSGAIRLGPNLNQKGSVSRRMYFDNQQTPYYEGSGTLTTATKSFASGVTPNLRELYYSLNGESLTVDVIGSPGTTSEEVVSQTLNGATEYDLTWTNKHTDFRVKASLSSASHTATPEISRIGVEGGDTTTLQWGVEGEWDGAASQQNVSHAAHGDYDPSDVQLGYDPATLPGTPTAYWPHHDASGNLREMMNGYDAVPENVDYDAEGAGVGSAIDYKGSESAYIKTLNYSSAGAIPQCSAIGWVNISDVNDDQFILSFDRNDYIRMTADTGSSSTRFDTTDSGNTTHDMSGGALPKGEWAMMGVVYDGTDKHIYINGTLDSTASNPHGGAALGSGANTRYGWLSEGSESSTEGGAVNGGKDIAGRMAEVVYWDNYALSSTEMQNLYDAIAGNSTSLITSEKVLE